MSNERPSNSPMAQFAMPKDEGPSKICTALWTRAIRGQNRKEQSVGLEVEMFAYDSKTFAPLGLPEARVSPGEIIQRLEALVPGSNLKVDASTNVIVGLELSNGSNFSLEPGGQIEFSSRPQPSLGKISEDTIEAFRLLEDAARGEVVFLDHGTNPIAPEELPLLVPKNRYQILDRYFRSEPGGRGFHMMRNTATIQPNIDVAGEEDWVDATNLTFVLTPFIRHLFANSDYFQGKRSHYSSERQAIWQKTDPTRSGIPLSVVFADDVPCAYADWAREANVFYVSNLPIEEQPKFGELTFSSWLQHGYKGTTPTLQDWENHLGTLFPDLRLRGFLEVRSVDAQSFEHAVAPLAFWTSLLQSKESRTRVWEFLLGLALGCGCSEFKEKEPKEVMKKLLSLNAEHSLFKDSRTHSKLLEFSIESLHERGENEAALAVKKFQSHLSVRDKNSLPLSGLDFVKAHATLHPSAQFQQNFIPSRNVATK